MANFKRKSDIITVQPEVELWSIAEAKDYLRIDSDNSDDNTILQAYIKSARQKAEAYCNRTFITQSHKLTLDSINAVYPEDKLSAGYFEIPYNYFMGGSDYIELPNKPVQSVTSFTYYDVNDNATVWSASNYNVDTASGRIFLKAGVSFPVTLRNRNAVEIIYVSGYGDDASDVPDAIRQGVMMMITEMYETRGLCEMSCGCKSLLDPYVNYTDAL